MSKLGSYDHMNSIPFSGPHIPMEELARQLEEMNYGTHRLLSAIVRVRRQYESRREMVGSCASPDWKMMTDGIEQLLNMGGF